MSLKSFRDPAGSVFIHNKRVLRAINQPYQAYFHSFLNSDLYKSLVGRGCFIPTKIIDEEQLINKVENPQDAPLPRTGMIVEHEPVLFPSYPYEWPPEMLYAAAHLTLDLAEELLASGFGIKDATPYNILFKASKPIFIDLLSVEQRHPGDPIWLPYAQFIRTFLLPLLVNKYFRLPLDGIFLTRRDGLEPNEVYPLCHPLKRFFPPFLSLISIPTWLSDRPSRGNGGAHAKQLRDKNPEQAEFILNSLLKRLRRQLKLLKPPTGRQSTWTNYMESHHYTHDQFAIKKDFVQQTLDLLKPKKVLDIGCNTGFFSAIASSAGAQVVAIDDQRDVVGRVWHKAHTENLNILPLVVNLGRPTPSVGWENNECLSFLQRSNGAFDMVLMLAIIHHLMITDGIPLTEIIRLVSSITRHAAIIEYVDPQDPMFQRLTRGRDDLYAGVSKDYFEQICAQRFDIIRQQKLGSSHRWLYLLQNKC